MTRIAIGLAAPKVPARSAAPARRNFLLGLVIASVGIVGTVLLSQSWGGLMPCELCLYERWPYYAAVVLGASALAVGRPVHRPALLVLSLLFIAGAALAFYHVGVEQHWFAGPSACTDSGGADTVEALTAQLMGRQPVLCDQPAWTFYGVSLAAFNLIASLLLAGFGLIGFARRPVLERTR